MVQTIPKARRIRTRTDLLELLIQNAHEAWRLEDGQFASIRITHSCGNESVVCTVHEQNGQRHELLKVIGSVNSYSVYLTNETTGTIRQQLRQEMVGLLLKNNYVLKQESFNGYSFYRKVE